ncbi:EamA family transporter [Aquibium oceanicum]|uniref:EamA family transporter n=2 Tax=Aquibium oceanicum TaxID=1670800 RepID=A0A1L3SZD3_9HYPH|nr:EamA family transporter [Aquibium oceanicum]
MLAGVACLSVNDALAKSLTATYSPVQILFIRNVIALPFALAVAYGMGGAPALRSRRPLAHLARGVLWLAAAVLFFTSIMHLKLAEATALIFAAPFFITAMSALVLRDHVGWRRWSAVIAGFVGVLIVVRPGAASFQPVALLPVATAFLYALLMLSARWLDPRESVWTLLLYLTGAGTLVAALAAPFVWREIQSEHILLFFAISLFGTVGMTMMTQAFRLAPAALIAPLDYTALVWATAFGWLIWREVPDTATFLGAAVIITSGVVVILREGRATD